MIYQVVSYAALTAYFAFTVDLFLQVKKVYKRKSSIDVSWPGIAVRLCGSSILFVKFILIQDIYLMMGQGLFASLVLVYLIVVFIYRQPNIGNNTLAKHRRTK